MTFTIPFLTGHGNLPLFDSKLAAKAFASGVSANELERLDPFSLFEAAIASFINFSICLSSFPISRCFLLIEALYFPMSFLIFHTSLIV